MLYEVITIICEPGADAIEWRHPLVTDFFNDPIRKGLAPDGGCISNMHHLFDAKEQCVISRWRDRVDHRAGEGTAVPNPLAKGRVSLVGKFDRRAAQFPARITSYNVCYTKLLRLSFLRGPHDGAV